MMLSLLLLAAATPAVSAADQTPAAARALVQRYYASVDAGRYADAYRLWSRDGQASGRSLQAFTAGYARTAHTRVRVGTPGRPEGAAGSVYLTVPVRVDATLKNGTRQRFTGRYVLRRVNAVPGATADQQRWHIESADLRPVR